MTDASEASPDLPDVLRTSWNRFLNTYEPLRSELYRYCRHLTRSAFDAEDLAQDVMARAFVTLGQMGAPPPNPRAWLFRVAHNLWIDQLRRRGEPRSHGAQVSEGDRARRGRRLGRSSASWRRRSARRWC